MIRKRRVIAVVVVLAVATIAACLGPSLSATRQEAVVIQQGSNVTIGDVMIGSSGSALVTISPASGSSSSSDTITMITKGSCPGFALDLPTLPAAVTRTCSGSGSTIASAVVVDSDTVPLCADSVYTFGVSYTPTSQGPASCTIVVSGSTFTNISFLVSANGIAQALAMDVTPKMIQFGDVRVGNTGSSSLAIRNAGSSPLTINTIAISPTTSYAVTSLGSANPIAPSKTETLTVTCTPTGSGAFNSTLNVAGSAGSQSVSLQCNGIFSALDVTPSPFDLTTRVGDLVQKDITVQNTGTAPAVLNSISIVPTVPAIPITIVSAPAAGFQLGSGSSTTIRVKYQPTVKQDATELARLRISHDSAQMRDVVINGAALETAMAVFPDSVDFGGICVGSTEMRDVDVKAGAPGAFRIEGFTPPAAPFSFTARSGTALPGTALGNQGNKFEFVAAVTPVAVATLLEGVVMLSTDIPGDTKHAIKLEAEVLPAGIGASPPGLDFGGVLKNSISPAQSTQVRNCTDAPFTIDDVHFEGPNKDDFSIVLPNPAKITLEPHESRDYFISVKGDTPGAKTATLVLSNGTASVRIAVTATALGGGGGGVVGERSYYTCSTGGGDAGVFALVVVLGLRRRRRM